MGRFSTLAARAAILLASFQLASGQLAACSVGVYTIAGAPASALFPIARIASSSYVGLAIDFNASRTRRIYWNEYSSSAPGSVIRFLSEDGSVGIYSGTSTAQGTADGALLSATWSQVNWLLVDQVTGVIYASDQNSNKIRKLTSASTSTVAGSAVSGCAGDGGPALSATLINVMGMVKDPDTGYINFLSAGSGCMRGRTLTPAGIVSSWMGVGSTGVTAGDGGLATAATFNYPSGLAMWREDSGTKHWFITVCVYC